MDLPLGSIDLSNDVFLSSYSFDLEPLVLSITTSGILTPLLVKQNGEAYTLICGHRRYCAAQKLGLKTIPVNIWAGSDREAFQTKLLEDRTIRSFNPIEKALLLQTCLRLGISTTDIISQYAQFIGIAPKKEPVTDHITLLSLEDFWKDRIAQGKLMLDTAGILTRWSANERNALQDLLMTYQVNLNKCREFVMFLDEVKLRDGTDIATLIAAIVRASERTVQTDQQFELFRVTLRRLRFPYLAPAEKEWNDTVPPLESATGSIIRPPANFEGETLTIQLSARSKEELAHKLDTLTGSLTSPQWDHAFKHL